MWLTCDGSNFVWSLQRVVRDNCCFGAFIASFRSLLVSPVHLALYRNSDDCLLGNIAVKYFEEIDIVFRCTYLYCAI